MTKNLMGLFILLFLSACATRGPVSIKCAGWDDYARELPLSKLVQDIQSDAVTSTSVTAPLDQLTTKGTGVSQDSFGNAGLFANGQSPPQLGSTLLLSGGGQWGAFGAGFIDQLANAKSDGLSALDEINIITGVSTGGLQALFVAVEDYDSLVQNYAPESESEIVDRQAFWKVPFSGSVAGLAPLRRKIEQALCREGDPKSGCPMIDALGESRKFAIIGFVHAASGKFYYVNANEIASSAMPGSDKTAISTRREAQQCLTGAALASAAMPVFFQQVQINGQTYYDGGARQSVFEPGIVEEITRLQTRQIKALMEVDGSVEKANEAELPPIYVIRNGPTVFPGDKDGKVNRKADALTAGQQAYSIMVNQVEVQSIASLRLAHPTGDIFLVTADGYDREHDGVSDGNTTPTREICRKQSEEIMFDPQFMACLTRLGRAKASRPEGKQWISLGELGTKAN